MRSMIVLGVCGLWAGCGGAPPSSGGEATFSITSVQRENGHETVQTTYVTASEYQKMFSSAAAAPPVRSSGEVGVAEQAIQQDNPCTGSSVHLFDNTTLGCEHNGCNTICFSGSGGADLDTYCRTYGVFGNCTAHWNAAVRSFNPDGNTGELYGSEFCYQTFSGSTWTNTTSCGSSAWLLSIN